MIIENGILSIKVKTSEGFDSDGFVLQPVEEVFSPSVPCQIIPLSVNNLATSSAGSAVIRRSYEILLDKNDVFREMQKTTFLHEEIKLVYNGVNLGEFSVISEQVLDTVNQIKITV